MEKSVWPSGNSRVLYIEYLPSEVEIEISCQSLRVTASDPITHDQNCYHVTRDDRRHQKFEKIDPHHHLIITIIHHQHGDVFILRTGIY